MTTRNFSKLMSIVICLVLIAAIALTMTACGNNTTTSDPVSGSQTATEEIKSIGEGEVEFNLTVSDFEGKSTVFAVCTNKKTVGDALLELELIEGEQSEYGLYIKKVNGITADYDADGTYWAFYINGEYASSGVDTTDITAGANYELRVSK